MTVWRARSKPRAMDNNQISEIQSCIGYEFKNADLLTAAFTHSSYVNEHPGVANERLEFLGDCVLDFLVGEKLFLSDRTAMEDKLSKSRSAIVSEIPLSGIIDELGLLQYLQVGAGVDKIKLKEKARSDLFEAILGAVYLDGGMEACKNVLEKIFYPLVKPAFDYKSELQVYAVKNSLGINYETSGKEGGFKSVVTVGDYKFCGEGQNKRNAERAAAKTAYEFFIQNKK